MTYKEVLEMKANLDKVNFIEDADPKFVYAVAKKMAIMELEDLDRVMNYITRISPPYPLLELAAEAKKALLRVSIADVEPPKKPDIKPVKEPKR